MEDQTIPGSFGCPRFNQIELREAVGVNRVPTGKFHLAGGRAFWEL